MRSSGRMTARRRGVGPRPLARELLAHAPFGIAYVLPDGRIARVNDALCAFLGYTHAELKAMHVGQITHPDDVAQEQHLLLQLLTGATPYQTLDKRYLRKDGAVVWGRLTAVASRDARGAARYLIGMVHDVTHQKATEQALLDEQELLRAALDTQQDVFYVIDRQGRFLRWNGRLSVVTGRSDAEIAAARATDFFEGADVGRVSAAIGEIWATGASKVEACLVARDGRRLPYEFTGTALRDAQGCITGLCGTGRDISLRRQMEAELRASEERWRLLVENHPEPIVISAGGVILYGNPAAARLVGLAAAEALPGRRFTEIVAPESHAMLADRLRAAEQGETLPPVEYPVRLLTGAHRFIEATAVPVLYQGRKAVQTVARDITAWKQAQAELRQAADRLQRLSRRLVEIQESERRFLARELHDEIGQSLTGMKILLDTCLRRAQGDLHDDLREVSDIAHALLARVRSLSLDLRPSMLDDLGLAPALLWLKTQVSKQSGISVDLRHSGIDRRFNPAVEITVYRIVQEALTNVVRHAQTDAATVRVTARPDVLTVEVADAGVGFSPEAVAGGASSGLSGMQERVSLLGGTLHIDAHRKRGTRITARLPLHPTPEPRAPN